MLPEVPTLPLKKVYADRDVVEIFPGRISLMTLRSTNFYGICFTSPNQPRSGVAKFDSEIKSGRRPKNVRRVVSNKSRSALGSHRVSNLLIQGEQSK
jgi:hypothetical protein